MRAIICDHCKEIIPESTPYFTLREDGSPLPVLSTGPATTNTTPEKHFHDLVHLKRWINAQTTIS